MELKKSVITARINVYRRADALTSIPDRLGLLSADNITDSDWQ